MLDYRLDKQELVELRATHRKALNVREAYRINAVILLGNGRTAADVPARCCLILVPFVSILSTTGRGGLKRCCA
jgi:hypothetical protein